MQKSVLAEIIRSLSKKEARDIAKWLQSPAHNQRQDVVRLFDYMTKTLTNGDESTEKQRAWAAVFPMQPYNDAYMRQVMYFLLKAIEEYLVFVDYTSDRVQYQMALMRTYRERHLEKAYKQAYRVGREFLEDQPLRDGYYLRNQFFLKQEYGRLSNIVPNASANLQEISDALEHWFLSEKLLLTYAMTAHRAVYKTAVYDDGILEGALKYVDEKGMLTEPAIGVYYYALMALKQPEEESYFDQLEHLIHNQEARFVPLEFRTIYLAAINYCVAKINQGRQDFAARVFELYRKGLEKGFLLENGIVSRYTFGNAVGAALRIREYAWAEKFIIDFNHHLDEKERNSIANFNLSRIYFEKGDYDKARELLMQFEYNDMLFNIIAKTMLLKIYYEEEEYDLFESLLESMRIYLQRKEALDPTRKSGYKNMISLMKKLVNMNPYAKPQKAKLLELVKETNPLMEREWLLRQLEAKGR